MQNVELLANKLDGFGDQLVGLVVAINAKQVGHDQEKSVMTENGPELVGCIDDSGHAISQNARVLSVQCKRSIDDVDEQMDIGGVGKVAGHGFEHSCDQADPIEFVQYIQTHQFLQYLQKGLSINISKGRVEDAKVFFGKNSRQMKEA